MLRLALHNFIIYVFVVIFIYLFYPRGKDQSGDIDSKKLRERVVRRQATKSSSISMTSSSKITPPTIPTTLPAPRDHLELYTRYL